MSEENVELARSVASNRDVSTGGFAPTATETAIVFSTDLKFTPGNVARCS